MTLKDRDVLIVEDIVDLGLTLDFLASSPPCHQPRTLKICCLIDKRERREWRSPWITTDLWWKKAFWWATAWTAAKANAPGRKFLCWKKIEAETRSSAHQISA